MNTLPDTTNYMIAGYAVFAVVFSVFITSLAFRWKKLKQDIQTLEELGKDSNP